MLVTPPRMRDDPTLTGLIHIFRMNDEIDYDKAQQIRMTSNDLGEVKDATVAMELPEINKLHLQDLPNLRSFSTADIVELSSLENFVMKYCPNLKRFGLGKINKTLLKSISIENYVQHEIDTIEYLFELSDEFSMITEYNVGDNEELGKVLDNLRPSHFTDLLSFQAKYCDKKMNRFLAILMKRSMKLEVIIIEQCKTSKYLFDLEGLSPEKDGYGKYFTQLKELKLSKLDQLDRIWSEDPSGVFGFGNLQLIHVEFCSNLFTAIPSNVAEKLHQLKELKLEACDKLLTVVVPAGIGRIRTIKFPALTKVEFKSLSWLWQFSDCHLEFPSLKTLAIEKCPDLEQFTTGFATSYERDITDGNSFSELNELKLHGCHDLVHVISSKTLQELRNLKKLVVIHCKKLRKVFNISGVIYNSTELLQQLDEMILIDLPHLTHIIQREFTMLYQNMQILQVKQCESLNRLAIPLMLTNIEIADCKVLEKIVIINKEAGATRKATFSQLKNVSLENLTNLSIAFPSSSEFPSLETLKIKNCPSLMTFVEESNELKESTTSNYFFPNSLSLDKLKVLYVINQNAEELWHCSCPSESFCDLENLTLSNNNKLLSVVSISMIIRFNKLEKMTLDKCEVLTWVFNLEDDKSYHKIQKMLPQLRTIALSNLNSLKSVWNNEPQVPFFPNLVSLFIVHCGALKSLFTLHSAKNLANLKLLKLCNCEEIEEVISSGEVENLSISFPKMECLILKNLPKLTSFCQQSGTFNWPNLQIVRVSNIPSMKTFSSGYLNTPLIRSVYITFSKKLWLGNLNNTISYVHNKTGYIADDKHEGEF